MKTRQGLRGRALVESRDQASRIGVDTAAGLLYNAPTYLTLYRSFAVTTQEQAYEPPQSRLPLTAVSLITCSPACTPFLLRPQLLTRV